MSLNRIVAAALELLDQGRVVQDLAGERFLITTGATREEIDPVRFISNRSSGRMGFAVAEAALSRGAEVSVVAGATSCWLSEWGPCCAEHYQQTRCMKRS